MAKKSKVTSADSARLVKRLREAHTQLQSHSTRAARAADALAQLLRQVEAQLGSADGAAATRARAPRTAARSSRSAAGRSGSRSPRTVSAPTSTTS